MGTYAYAHSSVRNPTALKQSHGNPVPALQHRVVLWHFDIGCVCIVKVTQHVAMHLSTSVNVKGSSSPLLLQ